MCFRLWVWRSDYDSVGWEFIECEAVDSGWLLQSGDRRVSCDICFGIRTVRREDDQL